MRSPAQHFLLFTIAVLLFTNQGSAVVRFRNYGQTITINAIEFDSSAIWVGTNGGLFRIDRTTGSGQLFSDSRSFPDLRIRSLAVDGDGTLWIGTEAGYLYKRQTSGKQEIITSYLAPSWDLRHLLHFRNYLIISSSRGISFYDKQKNLAVKNAVRFGDFSSSEVNIADIRGTDLLLGCKEGIASLPLSQIDSANFYDQSIWNTRKTALPTTNFVDNKGDPQAFGYPAAWYRDRLLHADSHAVYLDLNHRFSLPSRVNSIRVDDGSVWFGTEEHHLFLWDGQSAPVRKEISGLPFARISRVLSDFNGGVWVLSKYSAHPNTQWWQGIAHLSPENRWSFYNYTTPGFGWLGDGNAFRAACAQRKKGEQFWFGSHGGNVKCFNPQSGWRRYDVSGMNFNPGFDLVDAGNIFSWGKSDAIAQDSSGFMWIGSWNNYAGFLVCYDPVSENPHGLFRRFFPQGSEYFGTGEPNISALNVDRNGRIFAALENGDIIIIEHNGNPLQNGIQTMLLKGNGTVYDMETTPDGITWVVSQKGLYRIHPAPAVPAMIPVDDAPFGLTCIEAENDRLLWLGTAGRGLASFDPETKAIKYVTRAQGLISDHVNDLSIDRARGFLWVGTEEGLSRYDLLSSSSETTLSEPVSVYPNPYRKSAGRSEGIIFEKIPRGSSVHVYDSKGTLITTVPVYQGGTRTQWAFRWVPPRGIMPGTYYYVVRNERMSSQKGILLITP